jgi:hypothetical protein
MSSSKPNIAISVGGTKFGSAIVHSDPLAICAQTDRIEWRDLSAWKSSPRPETLFRLIAEKTFLLFQDSDFSFEDVCQIGLAWPGPGRYSQGLLTATFIPGCKEPQAIHEMVQAAFSSVFGMNCDSIEIVSALDVNVRSRGEVLHPQGALRHTESGQYPSGLVINIATGIAGAAVRDGRPLPSAFDLGETYGQWGRFLFYDRQNGEWIWRPTEDGSILPHDGSLIRFTELCGGPALSRRFAELVRGAPAGLVPSCLRQLATPVLPDPSQRNITAEKEFLRAITKAAHEGVPLVSDFIVRVGKEIGGALNQLINSIGEGDWDKIVLAGSVGENFGASQAGSPDMLIESIASVLPFAGLQIVRSQVGLDAEYIGFAPSVPKNLSCDEKENRNA